MRSTPKKPSLTPEPSTPSPKPPPTSKPLTTSDIMAAAKLLAKAGMSPTTPKHSPQPTQNNVSQAAQTPQPSVTNITNVQTIPDYQVTPTPGDPSLAQGNDTLPNWITTGAAAATATMDGDLSLGAQAAMTAADEPDPSAQQPSAS